ncbi:MAG: branched-chain amino acid ABC transporter permease, partial [Deltaproteobacteria bacterium]|nr:branched-chain amino acid ABC transporter permease [Deltaproteobacteria bacterium]
YGYLGICWNILSGYTGMLSLGHGALAGICAYVSVSLFIKMGITPWIGMFIGAVFTALIGMGITYLAARYGLKSMYFALLTLSFSEIIRLLTLHWEFVGGASGLLIPMTKSSIGNFQFSEKFMYYYVILTMVLSVVFISTKLVRSKIGYYLLAIKENEDAAETVGVHTSKYKVIASGISAFLTGFGGVFYAQYLMYISPDINLSLNFSIEIVSGVIIGGIGTIFGPLVGACILQLISEIFRVFLGQMGSVHLIAYGLMLMLVIIFLPKGIVGAIEKW